MTKKKKMVRLIVNSVLLMAIVALGLTVYQAENERRQELKFTQEQAMNESQEDQENQEEEAEDEEQQEVQEEDTVDTGASQVEAQIDSDTDMLEGEAAIPEPAESVVTDGSVTMESNFTEDTLMVWPLAGDILLDYNMEETIYHPTLDVYKLSPSIAISAPVDSQVLAAAGGTVSAITEDAETGTTVTVDMGNGYKAIYGQLKDVQVMQDEPISQSAILGVVAEPTKYYSVEGSNLYFAMTKDDVPIDPITYLP